MRVGGIVQVRLGSSRLPAKALESIAGRPALLHLLDRMFAAASLAPAQVVVCTTTDASDDPLVPVVESTGARVYRGSRDDLIDRFHGAVTEHDFDAVIQVDGDDICADPGYMDLAMERLLGDGSLDVVLCRHLPLGLASKAVSRAALDRVRKRYLPADNSTWASLYFTRSPLCRRAYVDPVADHHRHRRARLTLDYPEDLAFFRAVFGELYEPDDVFGVEELLALLRRRPELVEINAGLAEIYRSRNVELAKSQVMRYRDDDGVVREVTRG